MSKKERIQLYLSGIMLSIAILACNIQNINPQDPEPGSLADEVTKGNVRFDGTANITYIECMDPSAEVALLIGGSAQVIDGMDYGEKVNPVHISAVTNGRLIKTDQCEKTNTDEKHDWPAEGIYYPKEAKVIFFTCTQNNHEAKGEAYIVGDGFEGQYSCYDKNTGDLMYKVAFSAYDRIR